MGTRVAINRAMDIKNTEKEVIELIKSYPSYYSPKEIYHSILAETGICVSEKKIKEQTDPVMFKAHNK